MYSTNNEGKSVAAERFIRTIKTKNYKHMTTLSKNVYIDKLDDIVKNIIIHITQQLRWNQVMLKMMCNIDFRKEVNDKDPKFKVGDHVRISKYKNISDKGYTPNRAEEIFVSKIKNTVP